ncbi:TetR/AcrR family transcriptional regulator [Tsukamurella sp. 8F]|uniref:TetR/AcrR family transcriptional regulator n=1 Tax=unclassified Tsukamurella TaxID=2633480 RepID=UPI0023B89531|nr:MULTISPECIES: TetR/AcrR family transcriptional regulator [unclassified Tsukamurella]MDF0530493.1 TetR/AcrR family transcriptional regulator [Tsukamurella sp. 8J]MDF0587686.1 TetR/AcrR family transcriptional regulator [Tsukamurella sp. 8F]
MTERARPYHHGSLRADVIAAAVAEVEAVGAAAVSMREIARRAGVSHAAPVHHFGDKAGLFTAIAIEGFRRNRDATAAAVEGPRGFLAGGAAYVEFALANPGHFEVMFRPALYRADDPDLVEARDAAYAVLEASGAQAAAEAGIDDAYGVVLAGWSLAHGVATLLLTGNLDDRLPTETAEIMEHLGRGMTGLGYLIGQIAED